MCLVIRTMIYRYQQQKEKKRKKKKKREKKEHKRKRELPLLADHTMCIIPCVNILYIQKRNTNY